MISKNQYLLLLIMLLINFTSISSLEAQRAYLSLKEAVQLGLKENLSLRMAENQIEKATVNSGPGAAGMLPTVTASGNINYSLNNATTTFLDGRENKINGGTDFRIGGEVRLDWTIFAGKAMFVRRDQLENQKGLSALALKREAQTLSATITATYQNLVRQSALLNIFAEQINYLSDLLTLTSAKLEIGSATRLDVLQAQTDLNELRNTRELSKMAYDLGMADLNRALNRDADTSFGVDSSFLKPATLFPFVEWKTKAQANNYDIQFAQKELELARQDQKLAETERLPQVDITSGVNYNYLNSNTGFLSTNTAYGPFIGLTGRYNLYDGHRVKRNIQLAELDALDATLAIDENSRSAEHELFRSYQTYQYFIAQEKLERENLKLAEENFSLADELYRVGRINQFELRQVRIQRLDIERRMVQAAFQQALAYLRLMEVSGLSWL